MDGERDEFYVEQEDLHLHDELEDDGVRSIFAAGWFRAVLVLTTLAVVVVVALPYLLDWFEPAPSPIKGPPPVKEATRPLAAPASPTPVRVAQPRPAPAPPVTAATSKPVPAKPITPAAAMLPPYTRASERPSEPVRTPKAAEPAPSRTPELPRAASTNPSERAYEASRGHWVQLGLFKDLSNAERMAKTLRNQGFPVQLASVTRGLRDASAGETYHLVRVGAFSDEARALAARDDLRSRGYVGFVTEGAAK